jgi:phage-related baseplate assembly protein
VVNPKALGGGVAAETDAAFRARFANFINTRSLSTAAAVGYAVSTVPGAVSYALTQNYDLNGSYDPGSIYVVVDDGSGNPPGSLISSVSAAVDVTIGCGVRFSVYPPTLIPANVSMTLLTQSGYNHATIVAAVQSAVTAYINALPVGGTLAFNRLPQVAFDAAAGISNIEGPVVNGGNSDIVATAQQVIRTTSVVVL